MLFYYLVRDGRSATTLTSLPLGSVAAPARDFACWQNIAPLFNSPRRQSSLPAHPDFVISFLNAGWENRTLTGSVPQLDILFRFTHKISQSGFDSLNTPFQNKTTHKNCVVLFRCGMGESNSRPQFGKLMSYH